MRILGIDPGTGRLGFGVIAVGIIITGFTFFIITPALLVVREDQSNTDSRYFGLPFSYRIESPGGLGHFDLACDYTPCAEEDKLHDEVVLANRGKQNNVLPQYLMIDLLVWTILTGLIYYAVRKK